MYYIYILTDRIACVYVCPYTNILISEYIMSRFHSNDISNYNSRHSNNRVFAPADPLLSPDRLLRNKASPRGDFRSRYYHQLAGGADRRKTVPTDDPFTAILRPRNMSVNDDQFSMGGSDIDIADLPNINDVSPRMQREIKDELLDDEEDEDAKALPWVKSVFNLSNTSVGAGTLSLPFFYKSSGIVLGTVLLLTIASMSGFTLHLLAKLAQLEEGCGSYLTTAERAYGHRGTKLVQLAMFLLTFGAMTVYLIIIGSLSCQFLVTMVIDAPPSTVGGNHHGTPSHNDVMPSDASHHHNHSSMNSMYDTLWMAFVGKNGSHPINPPSPFGPGNGSTPIMPTKITSQCASGIGLPFWANRNIIVAMFLIFPMIPLSLKKNMRSLAFASILGLMSVLFVVTLVTQDALRKLSTGDIALPTQPGGAKYFVFNASIFFALPIVCLAYLNHPNIHATVEELENPTRSRVRSMVFSSSGLSTVFYVIMGICGYMRFGSIVEDDVLLNYIDLTWTNTLLFNCARIAMVLCLVVSYPLILFPSRMCFHVLLKDALPKGLKNYSGSFYFRAETFFIIGACFVISYLVPQIKTAFGLTGSITGCLMVYILPTVFYMKITEEGPCTTWTGFFATIVLILGVTLAVVCTGAILYQLASK